MTRHVLLDNVTHKDLRIHQRFAPGHGYDVQLARVFPIELAHLQAEYPLFFTKNRETGHFETVALLGFEEGQNLYLGGDHWRARVLPLTIERQPLLIGFQDQDEGGITTSTPVVHIDLDHPSVSHSEGVPLFLPHGGESPFLERASSLLRTIHESQESARMFSELLVGLELLESLELDVEFEDGSRSRLGGLFTIHEERLGDLNAGALEALHSPGHLQHVYMVLASLPNVSTLIERRNALTGE